VRSNKAGIKKGCKRDRVVERGFSRVLRTRRWRVAENANERVRSNDKASMHCFPAMSRASGRYRRICANEETWAVKRMKAEM